jgi:ElaB/YqjD/DUF883 family membrane-anchored ribosome-binding protein
MEYQNEKLEQILDQTTKTNGRVSKVEEEVEDLQKWKIKSDNSQGLNKWWITAIIAGIGFIAGLLVEYFKK